jgi:hypothetical protein
MQHNALFSPSAAAEQQQQLNPGLTLMQPFLTWPMKSKQAFRVSREKKESSVLASRTFAHDATTFLTSRNRSSSGAIARGVLSNAFQPGQFNRRSDSCLALAAS